MFPVSHVYMLNALVKKGLNRDLDKGDASQIAGVWLLDSVVRKPLREAFNGSQKHFHSMDYSVNDSLESGVLVHVFSDNLANCGTLYYDKSLQERKSGFITAREHRLHIPYEELVGSAGFGRKVLQCGLDMVIVQEHEHLLKKLFAHAAGLFKQQDFRESVFDMFVERISSYKDRPPEFDEAFIHGPLKSACFNNLKSIAYWYCDRWDEMILPKRRAKAAREAVPQQYKDALRNDGTEMHELILENIENGALDGWEGDVGSACHYILDSRPGVLSSFKC